MADQIIVDPDEPLYGVKVVYDPEQWGDKKPDITICKGESWADDVLKDSENWIGISEAHIVKGVVGWQNVD